MKRNFSEKSSKGISPKEAYISISFHIRDGEYAYAVKAKKSEV